MPSAHIPIHQPQDFQHMAEAGRLCATCLDYITPFVQPDATTEDIDAQCHQFITQHGAIPAPLNYQGYPKSICTSINHVVCHGIPSKRVLKNGDILNIDITVIYNGWHGDSSRMFVIGKPSIKAQRLIDTTYQALMLGIEAAKPDNTLGDIGYAIQSHVEKNRFSVVREFCGHGIGRVFHDSPQILHYGRPKNGTVLKPGMFFTIEPMVNAGKKDVKILQDGWTAVTKDRSLSAQFEHTIGITEEGCQIFTLSPKNYHYPPYTS
ncbi:MAG: type I methionyl aminopeptidase [Alphaproteobacteria bacterium GM202ARS2]|nr:type I methionyl aminopeptidase [Alphaproteobacteria bacterium GM202ARS2]